MEPSIPRILSPNLGCPVMILPGQLNERGFRVIVAQPADGIEEPVLTAQPSCPGEGEAFEMSLTEPQELEDDTLPASFQDIDDTRLILSTTLRFGVFGGKARFFAYRARSDSPIDGRKLRASAAGGGSLPTLYDLTLRVAGKDCFTAPHALCLREPGKALHFIHLTDLHVALRNDVYEEMLETILTHPPGHAGTEDLFINFNHNLRRFIHHANALADVGELDLVLMLGDLVDFLRHDFGEDESPAHNNWHAFREILLGTGAESTRRAGSPGIKVPIFTATGNHDWRIYPYDAALTPSPMRVPPEVAQELDVYWESTQEEIVKKREAVFKRLTEQGTMVSNKTLHGRAVNSLLRRLEKWQVQLGVPLGSAAIAEFLSKFPLVDQKLKSLLGSLSGPLVSAAVLNPVVMSIVVWLLLRILISAVRSYVGTGVMALVAIEADCKALRDYFLEINPYYNYAFRVDSTHFLILDSGHDCLYAQSFWDGGSEKMARVSIKDNILGGSPDTMAFYEPNEYYPYSQIAWIERVLELVHPGGRNATEDHPEGSESGRSGSHLRRVIIGVHSPPANLSAEDRDKAHALAKRRREGILLAKKQGFVKALHLYLERRNRDEPVYAFNIRYGTINHYLSHFFYLCLGMVERQPGIRRRPPVDMVLAGHAHWCVEFRLEPNDRERGIDVYYGDFTSDPEGLPERLDKLRPLLVQTPGCGPRDARHAAYPPYFRRITVEMGGAITRAEVLRLTPEGREVPAAKDEYPENSLI